MQVITNPCGRGGVTLMDFKVENELWTTNNKETLPAQVHSFSYLTFKKT